VQSQQNQLGADALRRYLTIQRSWFLHWGHV